MKKFFNTIIDMLTVSSRSLDEAKNNMEEYQNTGKLNYFFLQ